MAEQFEKLIDVISRSQHNYRELIDNLDQAVFTIGLDGEVRVANRRCCEVLGASFQELIGHRLGEFIEEPSIVQLQDAFSGFLKKGTWSGRVSVRFKKEKGARQFDCWFQAVPEEGATGAAIGWARDITETKQIEQQLVHSERFAAIGQMMAGAAHELNNPLTAILGVGDLLRERATDDAMRRHVDLIVQQARRAAAIVRDLMALSRPPSSALVSIRLDELVSEQLRKLEILWRAKNVALKFESTGNISPIEGDRKLLTQVFTNLLENAEHAISSLGGKPGTVTVSLAEKAGKVCIAFSDTGCGISPDQIGKIFDPFFTTKRPGGGSGLGLTICMAVAKEHGGTIKAESVPGQGSTFRVILPVLRAAPGATVPSSGAPQAQERVHRDSPSVLVVDDEEGIREIVQEVLSARGVRVECAAASDEALAQVAASAYDAILCDFNLPGMRGPQLCEKIRAQLGPKTPRFVFMTGELLDAAMINDFSSQGIAVLQKPFSMSVLTRLLTELLQSSRK